MADYYWPKQRKLLRAPNIGYNAEVHRHFKDIDDTPNRKAIRDLCLIGAKDSRGTAESKIRYFRNFVQKVHSKPTIVGELKTSRDQQIVYKCQVQLYFQQDKDAVSLGNAPVDAQITFRLEQTHETITEAQYKQLAAKIKAEFATGNGYTWNKGKHICWYKDELNGYDFQVYAMSENEGEQIIKKVMQLKGHAFDDKLFRVTTPKKNSDTTPGNVTILGTSRKKPRWRPTATVRFLWADLIIWNIPEPITLVDRTGIRYKPVELAL